MQVGGPSLESYSTSGLGASDPVYSMGTPSWNERRKLQKYAKQRAKQAKKEAERKERDEVKVRRDAV